MTSPTSQDFDYSSALAIIGTSGRFPGASNIDEFWDNLVGGVKSIRPLSEQELRDADVDPELLAQPNYVKVGSTIEKVDLFDAGFFGFTPREAEIMDPQQRIFLETAWEALENAAYDPERYKGMVGVFAGSGFSTYLLNNILANPDVVKLTSQLQIGIVNSPDSLASTVSYKCNFRGPSLAVQTFCSTSLVAVHLACQSLLNYECDMALAGGVAVSIPQTTGYLYQDGSILSPDGECRAFDARAQGSVMGNGVGIVVLKRLDEAIEDRDQIYAVIRGSTVNNDGIMRVGYTSPGLDGQTEVIAEAMSHAGVDAETIGYLEAHGTATPLGDAVELAAMIRAFRKNTAKQQFCAIGSVKPNIGHLDRASGVTGLIKTALILKHKLIPPSLNFEQGSPDIDLPSSPFYVNTSLREWNTNGQPRRAGVSSFGLGGTNAHVVLEETPEIEPSDPPKPYQLFLLSAKSSAALNAATTNLSKFFQQHAELNSADVAYTLQIGRATFNHRRMVVGRDLADAAQALERGDPQRVFTLNQTHRDRPVAFLLPGVGDHYAGMAQALYASEPDFKAVVDECCDLLQPLLGEDLRPLLFPATGPATAPRRFLQRDPAAPSNDPLHQTRLAQPAVFVIEYALARLLQGWGVEPQALLGYSLGEYVAACLAGVLPLPDMLRLVATRAQWIGELPPSTMLAVGLGADAAAPHLSADVTLAASLSPSACVVSGPEAALTALLTELQAKEIACRRLPTQHAFHSPLLHPLKERLTNFCRTLAFQPPQIPYLSNVTGDWITPEQATDPAYWATQMCAPVRFAEGVATLLATPQMLVEVGAGQALGSFVKQHGACSREQAGLVVGTLPGAQEATDALAALLGTLGKLWLHGVTIAWEEVWSHEQRQRIPLPTYPFERQRFWIEPAANAARLSQQAAATGKRADIADWFYLPAWRIAALPPSQASAAGSHECWVVFADNSDLSSELLRGLKQGGRKVFAVQVGAQFAQPQEGQFTIRPDQPADYQAVITSLLDARLMPTHVLHLWSLHDTPQAAPGAELFRASQTLGFYSLLFVAKALGELVVDEPIQMLVVTSSVQTVMSDEDVAVEHSTMLGACKVITQENATIACRNIDLAAPQNSNGSSQMLAEQVLAECTATITDLAVAYRGRDRWVPTYTPLRLEAPAAESVPLREQGVYLITGGLGGVGLILAEHLARTRHARLVLTGRSTLPPRSTWAEWLTTHEETDSASQKIQKVQALEALGAEVLVLSADVANETQMRAVIDQTVQQFGALHGVVYAAGISDLKAYASVQEIRPEQCEMHFQSKIYGLYVLEQVLQDQPLDFCLLFSSLSAVLGGLGFAGYASANCFIDAFVHRHNQTHPTRWIAVNWDTWHIKEGQHDVIGATVAEYEMQPAEGAAAFERVIATQRFDRIVNSTGDLQARIRQWLLLESLQSAATPSAPLPTHTRPDLPIAYVPATNDYERRIATIWQQALGLSEIGIHDNFFDLGGNSLIGVQVIAKLKQELKIPVPTVALFEAPTISALAQYLAPQLPAPPDQQTARLEERRQQARKANSSQDIAIIGMAGRFPGADTLDVFWENLRDGVESVTHFSDEELLAAGVAPELVRDPNYVKSRPILTNIDQFDAAFFGYTPREAALMDPQQRIFHECAWEALETAGYDSLRYKGLIGVFAGTNFSTYLMRLASDSELIASVGESTILSNDKDSLTTNVSYKLNLRGPSFAVQTFCSTSLVATHLACRTLRVGDCDIALAGGVSVRVPVNTGHLYKEGDQYSPDGHCRTFDAQAAGATFGDGVAIIVLKRLEDALADGDTIHAIIKGSAVNSDGGLKVGYTAPSVVGQSEVVIAALQDAGVSAETIDYIEAHGTATKLGDPIEVTSLTKAFRTMTDRTGYCAIGSVKPNVGHLDRAAGVTGLIKTVLALKHGWLPATLHFTQPNPDIDFATSPFVVNAALTPWTRNGHPRRAGVNSLGVGGTNAHVVLEEAPVVESVPSRRTQHLLLLSAKTPTALDAATANLCAYLAEHPTTPLADVAYTYQVGRRTFEHRRMVVGSTHQELIQALTTQDPRRVFTLVQPPATRPVAFLLPGVGDHYAGMAQALYASEPDFQHVVDQCCDLLQPLLGEDLRPLLFPANGPATAPRRFLQRDAAPSNDPLHQTRLAQPAVFVIEYALARLLLTWGLRPQALLGYSLGEYVAACLAGVLPLPDMLRLVATRAQWIGELPPSTMLAVGLGADAAAPYLSAEITLAASLSPSACVVSGPEAALTALQGQLQATEIACRRLPTQHAFHSPLLQPLRERLTDFCQTLAFQPPQIPYLSNVTGDWITPEQATDPAYWATQMCAPVRFAEGVATLLGTEGATPQVLVEIGAGQALGSFVKQHGACSREQAGLVVGTLPAAQDGTDALTALLNTLGRLWLLDVPITWEQVWSHEQRRRIPLPTYPFERQRFWIDPRPQTRSALEQTGESERRSDVGSWLTVPSWKRSAALDPYTAEAELTTEHCWVVLADAYGVGSHLAAWLVTRNQQVVTVQPGVAFANPSPNTYTLRPTHRADYDALLQDLQRRGQRPQHIVHLWSLTTAADPAFEQVMDLGFYSLMALTQAIGDGLPTPCTMSVISNEMQEVTATEHICPAKATLIGPCKVIPQEYPTVACRSIDLVLPSGGAPTPALIQQLATEILLGSADSFVALRGPHRWLPSFAPVALPATGRPPRLRSGGVYLITGGLGGIGLAVAEYLAQHYQAKVVLVGRSPLPPRAEWPQILASQDTNTGVARRIQHVQQLEAQGAEVLVLQADVADAIQMQVAVQQTLDRFGALHGVFHAAGVPAVGILQNKTREQAEGVFAPKIHGTLALVQAIQELPLDFLVLFSSVTSATGGGPGQADYCAANAFLDAYARRHVADHGITTAISWGEWLWDAWQDGLQGFPPEIRNFLIEYRRKYGITFEEGMEVIRRVLSSDLPQLYVTPQPIEDLMQLGGDFSASSLFEKLQEQRQAQPLFPRPVLATSYAAPDNPMEEQIAAIWGQVLGIEQVGVDDNFFELGGNSLIGIDLVTRVRKGLELEQLASHVLYEAPSVRAMAEHISQTQQETVKIKEWEDRADKRRENLKNFRRRQ